MTRHEFLAALHELLRPKVYVEIGVQYGNSLLLAGSDTRIVGIDPNPLVSSTRPEVRIETMTSDDFFAQRDEDIETILTGRIDLAFIDGMHLYEYAMRDFVNVERWASSRAVVAFDDVLPRNQDEASREMFTSDWTGDVWKVYPALKETRPDLELIMVDTQPTGTLLVLNLSTVFTLNDEVSVDDFVTDNVVPDDVINRSFAVSPDEALTRLAKIY